MQEQNKQQTKQVEAQAEAQTKTVEYDLRMRNDKALEFEKRITLELELENKMKLLEKASELERAKTSDSSGGESSYDKLDMPKESGMRMPSIGATPPSVQINSSSLS